MTSICLFITNILASIYWMIAWVVLIVIIILSVWLLNHSLTLRYLFIVFFNVRMMRIRCPIRLNLLLEMIMIVQMVFTTKNRWCLFCSAIVSFMLLLLSNNALQLIGYRICRQSTGRTRKCRRSCWEMLLLILRWWWLELYIGLTATDICFVSVVG